MKIIQTLLIALFSAGCLAETMTVSGDEIVGKWVSHYGFGAERPANATANTLEITKERNMTFQRVFDNGSSQLFTAAASGLEVAEDIFIFTFPGGNALSCKLVLGGWVNGENKLLFGTLYLYEQGQLFNGIPVSFKPDDSQ